MAEPEKNFFQQGIDGFSSVIQSAVELAKHVGWPLTVLIALGAACFFVWWKWKEIKELPGIEPIVAGFKRKPIPRASAGRLTIAVTHLARDNKDREHETLLRDELQQFEGIELVQPVDRKLDDGDRKKAEEDARGLLKQTEADVLIWGGVISLGGKSAMRDLHSPNMHATAR